MSHRGLVSGAALSLVIAFAPPVVVPVAGQAPAFAGATFTPPPSAYQPPRTPWGDPDLMGVWDYQSAIRMQRPANLAGKAKFTDEEYAAWVKSNAPNRDACGIGTRANEKCPENAPPDITYNEFWNQRNFVKNNNTALIVDPPDGRYPPLTPQAEERRKEIVAAARPHDTWTDYHGLDRCIATQTPNGPQAYNSGTYIMQSKESVMIVRERLDTRYIWIDGRPHIGQKIRQWNGDSIGHWEGNTLVVETTNFTNEQRLGGASGASVPAGIPFGNFRVIEYFVPVSASRIEYYATIIDPTTWTKPWTFNLPWERDNDYQILEYGCHEGNLAMENSLSGARALKTEAEKKGRK
jgi:hypothetical protein